MKTSPGVCVSAFGPMGRNDVGRIVLVLLALCAPGAQGAEPSTGFRFAARPPEGPVGDSCLVAGRAEKAPTLDGEINVAEWANAGSGSFTIPDGPVTRFYALWDDANLYLAFDCDEPTPQKIRALHGPDGRGHYGPDENGDVHCYNDDCVEVFLFPKEPGRQYQFVINSVDDRYDAFVEGTKDDPKWKGDWESKARVTADAWQVEMRIGLKSIGLDSREAPLAAMPRMTCSRARFATGSRQLQYWQEGRYTSQASRSLIFASAPGIAMRDVSYGRLSLGGGALTAKVMNNGSAARTVALTAAPGGQTRQLTLSAGQAADVALPLAFTTATTPFDLSVTMSDEQGQPLVAWREPGLRLATPITAYAEKVRFGPADGAISLFFDLEAGPAFLTGAQLRAEFVTPDQATIGQAQVGGGHGELVVAPGNWPQGERSIRLVLSDSASKEIYATAPLAFFWTGAEATVSKAGQVPLRIDLPENARALGAKLPITMGVPFAPDVVGAAADVSLFDDAGKPVACEVTPVQMWNRHQTSIKWAHLDFQVPGTAHGKTYVLKYGPGLAAVQPERAIQCDVTEKDIVVDTGAVRFRVRRDAFTLLDELACDLNSDGRYGEEEAVIMPGAANGLTVVDRAGRRYSSRQTIAFPEHCKVELERHGPMHAVIRAEGWHIADQETPLLPGEAQRKLKFIVRIHAYAGLPVVKVEHTFVMTEGYEEAFPEISLGLNLWPSTARTFTTAWIGMDNKREEKTLPASSHDILAATQLDWESFRLGRWEADAGVCSELLGLGRAGEGWVLVADGQRSIGVYGHDWRENYCKGYNLRGQELKLHIWPPQAGKQLSFHPRDYLPPNMVDKLSWDVKGTYFEPWTYKTNMVGFPPIGTGKTHEFVLDFAPADAGRTAAMQAVANDRALAVLSPQWYVDSTVFGRFGIRDPERFPVAEAALDAIADQVFYRQHEARDYGLIGFGNNKQMILNQQPGNWGVYRMYQGMGYGLPNQPWLLYARSGDRKFVREAHRMTRHVMDLSICHYGRRLGANSSAAPIHWAYHSAGSLALHVETQCLMRAYYMLGDLRARDVLDEILVTGRRVVVTPGKLTYRGFVDPQKNLIDLYDLTWDEDLIKVQKGLFEGWASAYDEWETSYHHYYAKVLMAVHTFNGDPRCIDLMQKMLERWPDRGYGTERHEELGAYLYQATGDKKWLDFVGGEERMNLVCSKVETKKPLPDRGTTYLYQKEKDRWFIDNFTGMATDKVLWKYVYYMGALADADQKK